jgi:hypothetical protein
MQDVHNAWLSVVPAKERNIIRHRAWAPIPQYLRSTFPYAIADDGHISQRTLSETSNEVGLGAALGKHRARQPHLHGAHERGLT